MDRDLSWLQPLRTVEKEKCARTSDHWCCTKKADPNGAKRVWQILWILGGLLWIRLQIPDTSSAHFMTWMDHMSVTWVQPWGLLMMSICLGATLRNPEESAPSKLENQHISGDIPGTPPSKRVVVMWPVGQLAKQKTCELMGPWFLNQKPVSWFIVLDFSMNSTHQRGSTHRRFFLLDRRCDV